MDKYCLEIYAHEDFDLIEDEEEREEKEEAFYDEIEAVYRYLKANKINCMNFEQIDDTRFSIEVDTYKNRFNDDVAYGYMSSIDDLLEINDIASASIENYKYI